MAAARRPALHDTRFDAFTRESTAELKRLFERRHPHRGLSRKEAAPFTTALTRLQGEIPYVWRHVPDNFSAADVANTIFEAYEAEAPEPGREPAASVRAVRSLHEAFPRTREGRRQFIARHFPVAFHGVSENARKTLRNALKILVRLHPRTPTHLLIGDLQAAMTRMPGLDSDTAAKWVLNEVKSAFNAQVPGTFHLRDPSKFRAPRAPRAARAARAPRKRTRTPSAERKRAPSGERKRSRSADTPRAIQIRAFKKIPEAVSAITVDGAKPATATADKLTRVMRTLAKVRMNKPSAEKNPETAAGNAVRSAIHTTETVWDNVQKDLHRIRVGRNIESDADLHLFLTVMRRYAQPGALRPARRPSVAS